MVNTTVFLIKRPLLACIYIYNPFFRLCSAFSSFIGSFKPIPISNENSGCVEMKIVAVLNHIRAPPLVSLHFRLMAVADTDSDTERSLNSISRH